MRLQHVLFYDRFLLLTLTYLMLMFNKCENKPTHLVPVGVPKSNVHQSHPRIVSPGLPGCPGVPEVARDIVVLGHGVRGVFRSS
jgi:hypothetical protein